MYSCIENVPALIFLELSEVTVNHMTMSILSVFRPADRTLLHRPTTNQNSVTRDFFF